MSYTFVTVIARLAPPDVDQARHIVEALGNPAKPELTAAFESVAEGKEGLAVHFSSINVFPATGGGGHLVFEFSADGDREALLDGLAKRLGPYLEPAFRLAEGRGTDSLARFWTSHLVNAGTGWFDNPGVLFAGTPGLSVNRIRKEGRLRDRLTSLVEDQDHGAASASALERMINVRETLQREPDWHWSLTAEDADALHDERTVAAALGPIVRVSVRKYAWPLAIPAVVAFVYALLADPSMAGVRHAFSVTVRTFGWTLVAALAALGAAYVILRRRENAEGGDDRTPNADAVARIIERENYASQNHLAGLSVMKPGLLRRFTLRLTFAAITELATHLYRPGWLGTLGTIHFARWVMVPGTGDLLFLSNYGGSWESYLEDFITKAHDGLTAVWSNCVGFPRARNLFQGGASDGDRFKRWARRHQVPTGSWYTAYPDLTTSQIRTNAAIRQGLGTIVTEEEATRWLSLFGSRPRPAAAMEVNKIQSITFGGMGFLSHGSCLAFSLAESGAPEWLREAKHDIAFGDGRRHGDRAIIMGLAASALTKLKLPAEGLETFPPIFLHGMNAPARSRILGDEGDQAPAAWTWGGTLRPVDGVLLIYAPTHAALGALRESVTSCLARYGHTVVTEVPFVPLPEKDATEEAQRIAKLEPFGFVDGVSQPVIRGTYKALRHADSIHVVEPGEFVLGYPDNHGHLPAGPTLDAIHDPTNSLPIPATGQHGFAHPIVNELRDLGRNGTFLVVRQLEQDYDGFWNYCREAAKQVKALFPHWQDVTPEFIAAKLVGRWPDGSSLVRFPYRPGSEEAGEAHPMVRAPAGAQETPQAADVTAPAAAASAQARAGSGRDRRKISVRQTRETVREVGMTPDNDFLFGTEDAQGLRCPFGAHIRRTNPRESFEPGSDEQLSITNRHRILRVGRRYQPEPGRGVGILFMCLNADLERQFEFVQQTWAQSPSFHGLRRERDPVLGHRASTSASDADDGFTIPTRDGPIRLRGMPEFVKMVGGGYFFVPGKALIDFLAS